MLQFLHRKNFLLRIISFTLLSNCLQVLSVPCYSPVCAGVLKHRALHASTFDDNLIPNSSFKPLPSQQNLATIQGKKLLIPGGWKTGKSKEAALQSEFYLDNKSKIRSIAIKAGHDHEGVWSTPLPSCEPGMHYNFSGEFYRESVENGVYPEINIWGQRYLLNTHRIHKKFQNILLTVTCPKGEIKKDNLFLFVNRYPGSFFSMRSPSLTKNNPYPVAIQTQKPIAKLRNSFFPVGVYGANLENLEKIQNIGCNAAIINADRELLKRCYELGLHCVVRTPRNLDKLASTVNQLEPEIINEQTVFYVNDEPGVHSFPTKQAEELNVILKKHFPEIPTSMAVVRPQVIRHYAKAADYFMLDQYPIPDMPLIWLSDSIDQASGQVGAQRTQAVIQAFGGPKWRKAGWPRRPTETEMTNLAFLSIVHGVQGLYFYTFSEIETDANRIEDFKKTISKLALINGWLSVPNSEDKLIIKFLTPYYSDPKGNPALHCAIKKKDDGAELLICVNTLQTYIDAEIMLQKTASKEWKELFTQKIYFSEAKTLFIPFSPYQVVAFESTPLQ